MKHLLSAFIMTSAALVLPHIQHPTPIAAPAATVPVRGPVPFGVGEKIEYRAKYGFINVGTGSMEVKSITTLRGRPVWHVEMRVAATKVPLNLYSVIGTFSSWMDTTTLSSLQYVSDQVERGRTRNRFFEIFPERSTYRQKLSPDTATEVASVTDPLDEASFLYYIRTIPLNVGDTLTLPRYFRPDRNPVTIRVLKKEEVSTPVGIFPSIVIQPTIKTNSGPFQDGADAKVWLSDDRSRIILKIYSKTNALAALHLDMIKYTPAKPR